MLTAPAAYAQTDDIPPTVESVTFYSDIGTQNAITEATIGDNVYVIVQFSENMRNINTVTGETFADFVPGRPHIRQRFTQNATVPFLTLSSLNIVAHGTPFPNDPSCRAASVPPATDRYLCVIRLNARQYDSEPLFINLPGDGSVSDVAGNALASAYLSSSPGLTLLPPPPTVVSVTHYPTAAAARTGIGSISDTWTSPNPIYSVIQFAGPALETNNGPPPAARPQIFHQLGSATSVQFSISSATTLPTDGECQLLDPGTANNQDQSYWCSHTPLSDTSGTYTIIVGTETVSEAGVNLEAEYNSDPGIMFNTPNARLNIADFSVTETASTATVRVQLIGTVANGFSVDVSTSDGTAVSDEDYTASSDTLTFEGTHNEIQTVSITILADDTDEDDETLTVSLSNLRGTTSTVNFSDTATITITENLLLRIKAFLEGAQ